MSGQNTHKICNIYVIQGTDFRLDYARKDYINKYFNMILKLNLVGAC